MQDEEARPVATDTPLNVTRHLLRLEKDGALLLANALRLKPLLVRRGGAFVEEILATVNAARCSQQDLLARWPRDAGVFSFLLAHHILVAAGDEERLDGRVPPPAPGEKSPGMSLYLLLSQDCNLGCVYCLNGKRTYRKAEQPRMSEVVAFRAVETFAAAIQPGGYLEIALFGGEPLLNWELAKKTIDYTEQVLRPRYPDVRFCYHVTSNLSLLPDDFIERARRHNMTVLCDIDGAGAVHDALRPFKGGGSSHGQIARNVRQLIGAGIPVSLRTTVTARNQDDMEATARHHRELGAIGSAFVPVNITNSDEELIGDDLIPDIERMLAAFEGIKDCGQWSLDRLFPFSTYRAKLQPGNQSVLGCGAPFGNTPVVDAEGNVYPCIYLVGIERYHQGNIIAGTYPRAAVLAELAEQLHVDTREDCRICAWRYLCGGGCPIHLLTMAEQTGISPKARDYCDRINCAHTKKVLEILLWEMAEQAARQADGQERRKEDE